MEIPSTKPYFSEENIKDISAEIGSILRSGRLILGPYTEKLESAFRDYCGVKYAVAVSSCTAALEICLRYFNVDRKEVIVPTNTFLATSNSVIYSGGIPVLTDIKPDTLCLDPGEFLKRITPLTRGVIVVHVGGLPCPDIDEIRQICQEWGLFLIEDVAHAHGALINGRKTGGLGDAGCFSFYPTKVMTTGTGGMVTTNDSQLAQFAISLRHHGVGKGLHHIINLGNDWLMDEISALLGIHQLQSLESNLNLRNRIAQRYAGALSAIESIETFNISPSIRHSYYKYPVRLAEKINKPLFVEKMQTEAGIGIGSIYDPPCHLQPVYQRLFGFHEGMFPVAENTLKQTACLPMFAQMTDAELDYILKSIERILPDCLKEQVQV